MAGVGFEISHERVVLYQVEVLLERSPVPEKDARCFGTKRVGAADDSGMGNPGVRHLAGCKPQLSGAKGGTPGARSQEIDTAPCFHLGF
jgi:hypothetical protein